MHKPTLDTPLDLGLFPRVPEPQAWLCSITFDKVVSGTL